MSSCCCWLPIKNNPSYVYLFKSHQTVHSSLSMSEVISPFMNCLSRNSSDRSMLEVHACQPHFSVEVWCMPTFQQYCGLKAYLSVEVCEFGVEEAAGKAAEAQVWAQTCRTGQQGVGVHPGPLKVGHPSLHTRDHTIKIADMIPLNHYKDQERVAEYNCHSCLLPILCKSLQSRNM